MTGFAQRLVMVTALALSTGHLHAGPATGLNKVEVEVFETPICVLELVKPIGTMEIVLMTGDAAEHVFFEGALNGSANDDDGDGFDEVRTEMVKLTMSGYSPSLGPVHMRLNTDLRSTGEMREETNKSPGVLEVPPFAPSGRVDCRFDMSFEVEINGKLMYTNHPVLWRGMLTDTPAGPMDWYENLEDVELVDANGISTGFLLSASQYRPKPIVETDVFDTSMGKLKLLSQGRKHSVELAGQSTMRVFFDRDTKGSANDRDVDGYDDVRMELTELDLSGFSPELGTVHMELDTRVPSFGEIEEVTNIRMGMLDLPPFAATGRAFSFYEVFFKIEIGARVMYGERPLRLYGLLNKKPAATGDIYESLVDVRLVDANGEPTDYFLAATFYKPMVCGDSDNPYPTVDLNQVSELDFSDFAVFSRHRLE